MTKTTQPDPRINAFRPDLADAALQPYVKAARYVVPVMRHCTQGVVPLWAAPCEGARRVSEIRFGEFLDVVEERDDGYAWVQSRFDRSVGYIKAADALSEEIGDLSNRVKVLRTFVYQEPDRQSAVLDCLTLGSYAQIRAGEGGFVSLTSGGYVYAAHIGATPETLCADYVFTAGRLLNVPFLTGGRTPFGLDSAGLVQLALEMAGIDAPRESDLQRLLFGQALPQHWRDIPWRRGDIVFFKGHVGIMADHAALIHASPDLMQVAVTPLDEVVGAAGDIIAYGRPFR